MHRSDAAAIVAIFLLAVPLSLGAFYRMEISPAFFLAPAIAFLYFRNITDSLNIAFLVAAIAGLGSIAIVNLTGPSQWVANTANLVFEFLFVSSFVFLGRAIAERMPLNRIIFWFAVASSVFLILATVPLLVSGETIRATNPNGTVFLNVRLLGLPVFATYGVNSIAPLFAIQAALICGAINNTTRPAQFFFSIALACAVFLVIGSESRATQMSLLVLLPALAWCWVRETKWTAGLISTSLLVAVGVSFGQTAPSEMRLTDALSDTKQLVMPEPKNTAEPKSAQLDQPVEQPTATRTADEISTGRTLLWQAALDEWTRSPLAGNAFAGFGRFGTPPPGIGGNVTAHNYPINILWKGGLLFAIPFAAFILITLRDAFKARMATPEWVFAATAVLMAFTFPSLLWDILIVPSAGAVAWFMLGALGAKQEV